MIRNLVIFYGEELLAPRPTPKLEDHPLSAVRDCLFNLFAATLHIRRPFLHLQPEEAPCRGDRDRLILARFEHSALKPHVFINYLCVVYSNPLRLCCNIRVQYKEITRASDNIALHCTYSSCLKAHNVPYLRKVQ
jgi:hypothetical protein